MNLFLVVLAAAVAYGLLVYASPHHRCPKCKGKRVVMRKGKRPRQCPKCRGRGKCQRAGARVVHRAYWSIAGDRLRERRKAQLKGDGHGDT